MTTTVEREKPLKRHEVWPFVSDKGKVNWQLRFKAARAIKSHELGSLKGIPAGLLNYSPTNVGQPTTAEKKRRRHKNYPALKKVVEQDE